MSTTVRKFKDCEACGNFLIQQHKKYCSGCWEGIKAKEKSDKSLLKRLDALEKRVAKLTGK
jgi:hypothetical protein